MHCADRRAQLVLVLCCVNGGRMSRSQTFNDLSFAVRSWTLRPNRRKLAIATKIQDHLARTVLICKPSAFPHPVTCLWRGAQRGERCSKWQEQKQLQQGQTHRKCSDYIVKSQFGRPRDALGTHRHYLVEGSGLHKLAAVKDRSACGCASTGASPR